ncbi:hypothetical protein [Nocardioides sp.]|uniref:hypothetical protein n=1 Tax=Nocardioides sp. TaxID=35761 RepID=UPI0035616526
MGRTRTRAATRQDARARAQSAAAYLVAAELVLDEPDAAMPGVAAGVAVLAGIAASDAITATRLQLIHRGDDHRSAADLLAQATPDGKKLAATFKRLIDLKDEAHYGLTLVAPRKARDAVRWAQILLERANEELER